MEQYSGTIEHVMTTTGFELPGYRIVKNLGVARGVTVRSRGLAGQLIAGLRTIVGGRIEEYIEMCEWARDEAFELLIRDANRLHANAVIGIRYDATELGTNMTEVLAYGTAVIVEPS